MNYKEHLEVMEDILKNKDFYMYKMICAYELKNYLNNYDLKLNNEDFETISDFIYNVYIKYDYNPSAVIQVIIKKLKDNFIGIEDINIYNNFIINIINELV